MLHDAPDWLPDWIRRLYHFWRGCACCEWECDWDNVGCPYCLSAQDDLEEIE